MKASERARFFFVRVYWFWRSWYWRSRFLQTMEKALDRRVNVEIYLFDCAAGKKPLPDKEKCRRIALYLGDANYKEKP